MNALTYSPITLSTAHLYPLQQVFDKVAKHLLTQNKRAMKDFRGEYPADRCAYRGDDGSTCAVGCLLSDDEYRPTFEGKASGTLLRTLLGVDTLPDEVMPYRNLLASLQNVHDTYEPDEWPWKLADVARVYNLKFTA